MYFTYNYSITFHYPFFIFDMATGQPDETASTQSVKPLTKLQQGFAYQYALLWKAAPAYRAAGGAEKGAKQNALALLKDERVLVEAAKLGMSVEEATARMAGWARVTMDDLLRFEQEPYTPRFFRPVSELYDEVQEEIDFEEEFARRAGYGKKELKRHRLMIAGLKRRQLRYEILMQKNPDATELAPGRTIMRQVAYVDLDKAREMHPRPMATR
jgi:hypothetical protein